MENVKWLNKIGSGGFTKLNKKLKNIVEHNYIHLTKEMTVEDGSGLKLYKPSEFDFKL
jgi:hypothetical protein